MISPSDIDQLPPQVRRVAQKSAPLVARLAHRIAEMPASGRKTAYREAEATFRQTAAANDLAGLMIERFVRYMHPALSDAVRKIDDKAGPRGVA